MHNAIASTAKSIEEFRAAFQAGVDGICRAAAIYVKAIDADPAIIDEFHQTFADTIPMSAWKGFEAVGRKSLHPNLLLGGGGQHAASIKRLPYSEQERIFAGHKHTLLTSDGDRLPVDLRQVTRDQARQLFDCDHVRTLSEQKAWIEQEKTTQVNRDSVVELPYIILGGKVIFKARTSMTKTELKRILMEL